MSYDAPPPPPPPPGYGAGYPGQPAGDHPKATTILVLGILSLVCCGPLGIAAWVMGKRALAEIDASGGRIGGRGTVKAGYICGMIATILFVLGILFYIIVVVIAGVGSLSGSNY